MITNRIHAFRHLLLSDDRVHFKAKMLLIPRISGVSSAKSSKNAPDDFMEKVIIVAIADNGAIG